MRSSGSSLTAGRINGSRTKLFGIIFTLLIALAVNGFQSESQANAQFPCDGTIYYSLNLDAGFTQLATLNHDTRSFNYIGSAQPRYNGIGINPLDGLLYATVPNTAEIFRIDANGNFVSIGLATGALPSGGGWVSAGFLPDGRFVINQANDGAIVVLEDLELGRPVVVSTASYGVGNYIDVAYNPDDGLLYSYEKRDLLQLTAIDPYTGETDFLGVSNEDVMPGTGGLAFDSEGNLFSIGGSGGANLSETNFKIYQFDIDSSSPSFGLSQVFMETNHAASGVDATSCYF